MNQSTALCLAAFSMVAHGCYRYVTPAYATVTVRAPAQSNVTVSYGEPMNEGIWLQHAYYGPVWLPSESAAASSLWTEDGLLPRVGALAWSPAVSQWVWLDALEQPRATTAMIWSTSGAVPRADQTLLSSGVRAVVGGLKPVRPLSTVLTTDAVAHSSEPSASVEVVTRSEPVVVHDVVVARPDTLGPQPIPSAPIAGDIVHTDVTTETVAPVVPMRISAASPRRIYR